MALAHIGGVAVEETLQPVLIALLLSGAWVGARLRRPWRSLSCRHSEVIVKRGQQSAPDQPRS